MLRKKAEGGKNKKAEGRQKGGTKAEGRKNKKALSIKATDKHGLKKSAKGRSHG